MRHVRAVILGASTCFCVGASAQQLTITGRVVGADSSPLTKAFVFLDSLKIISRVDSNGRYTLSVPIVVARGQQEKVVAFADGHLRSSATATLTGATLVRDFVLQVDTMPEHNRRFPKLSDGHTPKSATDVTISGRVVDDAAVAMRTAMVRLEGTGFAAMTDDSGHYSLVIPARDSRRQAKFSVRLIGYAPTTDSTLLTGKATTRDFVLSKPVYSATAIPLGAEVLRATGLADLRDGPHRTGDREIRIETDVGYVQPNYIFRFLNRAGKATGEVILYVPPKESDARAGSMSEAGRPLPKCTGTIDEVFPCRARFTREPNWSRLWKTLDSLDVWNIVDEGTLHESRTMVLDGSSITAEMWDGNEYTAWAYASGVEDRELGRARVTAVSQLLHGIDSLMVP